MLNNPFFCTNDAVLQEEARRLIEHISSSDALHGRFSAGKMLGVLKVRTPEGEERTLRAFSGQDDGNHTPEGFVPPVFAFHPADVDSASPEESRTLQRWLFSQYRLRNALGEECSVWDIFSAEGRVPPAGAGDCAAPKLLHYAFCRGMEPLAIGEFWYGAAPLHEIRRHGAFYPACTGKCGPLLRFMLRGTEVAPDLFPGDAPWGLDRPVIRFEDRSLAVVEKPAGMLAVPGRVAGRTSLQEWLEAETGCRFYPCHRLDMDTSGLMLFARDPVAETALRRQFEEREVQKSYLARLVPGDEPPLRGGEKGKITLALAPDWDDRPRRRVDPEGGKPAVTGYEILRVLPDGTVEAALVPFTGRTHQLRVHCAHPLGLGRPILGDRLYGGLLPGHPQASRLMLHAASLSFRHPVTASRLRFHSPMH